MCCVRTSAVLSLVCGCDLVDIIVGGDGAFEKSQEADDVSYDTAEDKTLPWAPPRIVR